MNGILQQHSEIENLRKEYQLMAQRGFIPQNIEELTETFVLEECEL